MSDTIKCPKCASTQLSANKKGFSAGKAAAGAVLTGGVGLLAGTIGSNKIIITCLNCGNQFKPGEKPIAKAPQKITPARLRLTGDICLIFGIIFVILGLVFIISEAYVFGGTMTLIAIFLCGMYTSNRKQARQMEIEDREKV